MGVCELLTVEAMVRPGYEVAFIRFAQLQKQQDTPWPYSFDFVTHVVSGHDHDIKIISKCRLAPNPLIATAFHSSTTLRYFAQKHEALF